MPKVKERGRPPRKIDNPAYIEYENARRKENYQHGMDYPYEDRYPEEEGKKLPEDGAWIMMLMSVNVGRKLDDETVMQINVPHLSIWFATPTFTRDGLYQAVIQTPEGTVHVWPHEYAITNIEKWLAFTDEDGFHIHFLTESAAFNPEALFYLRTRGIGKAEAQRMLLPSLKDPNYCYFTFADELSSYFAEGTGTPYLVGSRRHRA